MASQSSAKSDPPKPGPTTHTKANRLPAPTLFVGPPSRNASQLSVGRQGVDDKRAARDPLTRQRSALAKPTDNATDQKDSNGTLRLRKASEKSVDEKWRQLQSTLNEVELTAQSSTHVFGASHAAALDELRRAQVELARAWGRGNEENATKAADDNIQRESDNQMQRFGGADTIAEERRQDQRKRTDTNSSASTTLSDESSAASAHTMRSARSQLEDETAQDIKLASERRAANEAYFKKVDEGVKDVVAKLETVAEAMRTVEGESRSLWSNSSRTSENTEREGGKQMPLEATG